MLLFMSARIAKLICRSPPVFLQQPGLLCVPGRIQFPYHTGAKRSTQLTRSRKQHLRPRPWPKGDEAMPKAGKFKRGATKFYAVKIGRQPGVYSSWDETEAQVNLPCTPRISNQELTLRSSSIPALFTRRSKPRKKRK
jgi:hypothetical protein